MASPSRTFVGLSQADLDTLRTTALDRITNGDVESTSGSGKSGTIKYSMTGKEMLEAIVFAEEQARGGRVSRVVNVTTRRGSH